MRPAGLIAGVLLLALLGGLVAFGSGLDRPLGKTGTLVAVAPAPTVSPTAVAAGSPTSAPSAASTTPPPSAALTPTATASATTVPTASTTPMPTVASTVTPIPTPAGQLINSSDGNAQLFIPDGALQPGVNVTVTALNESSLPPELKGIIVRVNFYRIQPADAALSTPATFIRVVDPTSVGFTLDDQKAPVIFLSRRDSSGTWSSPDAQTETMHPTGLVGVTGQLPAFGDIYGFGSTAIFVKQDSPDTVAVASGGAATIDISLNFPAALASANRPRIDGAAPPIASAAGIVQLATPTVAAAAKGVQRLTVGATCVAPGAVTLSSSFTVSNIGAGQSLLDTLHLTPVSVTFTVETAITCG